MSFPRYPSYKDSGIEWLGQVPEHWEIARIKRLVTLRNQRCNNIPDDWQYIGLEDVEPETGIYKPTETNSRQSEDSTAGIFQNGDVLYGKLRPYLKKAIVCSDEGACSTEFLVLQPNRINASWLHRYLLTQKVTQQIESGCDGAKMPRADWEHISAIPVPFPSQKEQEEINFKLVQETARIDALIAKKNRFIELITEKMLALVARTLEHQNASWIRLQHVCDIINRPVAQQDSESYTRLGLYNWGRGVFKKEEADNEDMGDSSFFWVEEGDLILSGQFAWEGAVAMALKEHTGCVVSHRFPVIRGRRGVALTEYLFALFMTDYGDFILNDCSRGSAGRNRPLNLSALLKWKIPIPPIEYQKQVLALVTLREKLGVKTQHSITLLKERRSALITAAVTGQIDLRESS